MCQRYLNVSEKLFLQQQMLLQNILKFSRWLFRRCFCISIIISYLVYTNVVKLYCVHTGSRLLAGQLVWFGWLGL